MVRQGDVDELVKVPCATNGETKPRQGTYVKGRQRTSRERGGAMVGRWGCVSSVETKK